MAGNAVARREGWPSTLVLTLVQFLPIDFLFFCLLVCLVIFLNVVQDVLGSRTAVIKPLIM